MVRSTEIVERIETALSKEDRKAVEGVFNEIRNHPGRRSRKALVNEINGLIIETALKNNKPSILTALPDVPGNDIASLFPKIISHYIKTKDEVWLDCLLSLSKRMGKKSCQSHVYAMMAHDLIEAGVSETNAALIDQGIMMLNRVIFRKYRSDIMIEVVPLLIVWAIATLDEQLLYSSLKSIEEISDISKRAVLHAELTKAITTIAVLKKNHDLYLQSIRSATKIHQKIRRQECLSVIIEKGAKSVFGKEMANISGFVQNFRDVQPDEFLEIVNALTEQFLDRVKNKPQIYDTLHDLSAEDPNVLNVIVASLLKKAEKSGDRWFLVTAMQLLTDIQGSAEYPVREMVKAGIAVARSSKNMQILKDLIPLVEKNCAPGFLSKTFLQFSQIMVASGDFDSAMEVFPKISDKSEINAQFQDGLISLMKMGILQDGVTQIQAKIFPGIPDEILHATIYKAVMDAGKEYTYQEIIAHIQSLVSLVTLHPRKDQILLEYISLAIERGFLDANDPGPLIKLAESISDLNTKERAVSNIVIKIARLGVQIRSRDHIQRAVGLTCAIDGQNTRSITLSTIIDEVAILAAQDGDLDLLLRMREWSHSLLEKDLASFAMANIIEGVLKYAFDRNSEDALERASAIVNDIDDPSMRAQIHERIAESFVKVGCRILSGEQNQDLPVLMHPFKRGLEIIQKTSKTPQISLKIAGMIDIMLSYSRTSTNQDFIVALGMYAIEINNIFERDAMLHRIVSNLNSEIIHPNSTDPYEIVAYLLQKNTRATADPEVLELIYSILGRVNDKYHQLSGMCDLAELFFKSKHQKRAEEILGIVKESIHLLSTTNEKIFILSNLASLYSHFDPDLMATCLRQAISLLDSIEFDKNAEVRRHIVESIARIQRVIPAKENCPVALQIAEQISDPVEYIHALIAIHSICQNDEVRRREILDLMIKAAARIPSPYEKITILLEIFKLSLEESTDESLVAILNNAEQLTRKINIQYIIDTLLDNISGLFFVLYNKKGTKAYLTKALEVAKTIDDDQMRTRRLAVLGHEEAFETPSPYQKIRNLSEKIIENGVHSSQISSLERLIRAVADRGKEAVFFCDCAILFRNKGEEKLSRKMMQSAVREARIIRPLSRRAYIMCDIAMKISAAGCERPALEVLDLAIDAATNIRQASLRDEVFDELGLAIKIIQEM